MTEHAAHDHDYDGIVEEDNPLPLWWLGTFVVTVVFGYGYWFYYHVSEAAPGLVGELEQAEAEQARITAAQKPVTDELLIQISKDRQSVDQGAKTFAVHCASCHGEQGEGKIGPNLTDAYWLHGGEPTLIHEIVSAGFVPKGMPAWKTVLGADKVREVAAFLVSIKGQNVPGKEPQGELAK